ncbi:hypothetical protein EXIGLDRAFT_783883, partial [Exidia glandulosa HHB12029]
MALDDGFASSPVLSDAFPRSTSTSTPNRFSDSFATSHAPLRAWSERCDESLSGSGEGFSRCGPYDISAAPHFVSTSLALSTRATRLLPRGNVSHTYASLASESHSIFGPFRITTVDFASHRPSQLRTSRSGEAQHFRTLASPRYPIACDFDRLLHFPGPTGPRQSRGAAHLRQGPPPASPSQPEPKRDFLALSRRTSASKTVWTPSHSMETMPAGGESSQTVFLSRTTRVFDSSLPGLSPCPRDVLAASGWILRSSRLLREALTTLALLYTGPHRTAGGVGTRTARCYLAFIARAFDT